MPSAFDPRTALRYGVYAVIGLLLAVGVWSLRPHAPADNPAYDALAKALGRRMVADSLALVDAREALAVAQAKVAPAIVRYRIARDTVLQHLTDTVRVKEYVAHADSVVRGCAELLTASSLYATRCDSAQASLRLDRDRWKLQAEHNAPGRWDGVKTWAIRIGIGVGAFKLGQSVR